MWISEHESHWSNSTLAQTKFVLVQGKIRMVIFYLSLSLLSRGVYSRVHAPLYDNHSRNFK